jgi:hypothetical protein
VYSLKTKSCALVFFAKALSSIFGIRFAGGNSIWTPTMEIGRNLRFDSAKAGRKSAIKYNKIRNKKKITVSSFRDLALK